MPIDDTWRVERVLGRETFVSGRIRLEGNEIIGTGRSNKRSYDLEHEWLQTFRNAAESTGGAFVEREMVLSQSSPDRDAGLLRDDEEGYFGGWITSVADVAVATWAAAGGVKGITEFLKLLKELKSFWTKDATVEVTLAGGEKVTLSTAGDVNYILQKIDALAASADRKSLRANASGAHPDTVENKRNARPQKRKSKK
jgi:hypothetical protein